MNLWITSHISNILSWSSFEDVVHTAHRAKIWLPRRARGKDTASVTLLRFMMSKSEIYLAQTLAKMVINERTRNDWNLMFWNINTNFSANTLTRIFKHSSPHLEGYTQFNSLRGKLKPVSISITFPLIRQPTVRWFEESYPAQKWISNHSVVPPRKIIHTACSSGSTHSCMQRAASGTKQEKWKVIISWHQETKFNLHVHEFFIFKVLHKY
jgi:hypothetical protein